MRRGGMQCCTKESRVVVARDQTSGREERVEVEGEEGIRKRRGVFRGQWRATMKEIRYAPWWFFE